MQSSPLFLWVFTFKIMNRKLGECWFEPKKFTILNNYYQFLAIYLYIFLMLASHISYLQFSNNFLQSVIIQFIGEKDLPFFATSVLVRVESSSFLLRSQSTMLPCFGLSYLLCELVCFWNKFEELAGFQPRTSRSPWERSIH